MDTTTPLQDLMAELGRHARRQFGLFGKINMPQWMLENEHGDRAIVVIDMSVGKDMVAAVMSRVLKENQAVRYASLMEVWSATGAAGEVYRGPPPSQRADRGEAVMVTGEDISGEKRCWFYPIDRSGRKPKLKERQEEKVVFGRFVDLFPRTDKPQ